MDPMTIGTPNQINVSFTAHDMDRVIKALYEKIGATSNPDVALYLSQKVADWEERKILYLVSKMNNNLTPEEELLVTNGNRIEAIKSIRARCGCSLSEAKSRVDAFLPF